MLESDLTAAEVFTIHPIQDLRIEPPTDAITALDGAPVFATTELGALTTIASGGGFSLDVTLEAEWSSSDDGIATVSAGLVGPQTEGAVTFQGDAGRGDRIARRARGGADHPVVGTLVAVRSGR